jgi:carbon-monoxide dehydrogenase large subunit
VRPDGGVDLGIGTLSSGQGHETSFAQLVVEWLGVDLAQVRVITGDTDVAAVGGGSHSGRSMRMAGWVMAKAADEIVARGTLITARLLEAAEADLEFARGRFVVRGTDRGVDLRAVAAATDGPLTGVGDETGQMRAASFMDYALPRADHFSRFETEISEIPSTTNPLGLRGGGEGGTTPALGAVVNAIVDALAELGVEHVDMPATPARVWRAIQDVKAAKARA